MVHHHSFFVSYPLFAEWVILYGAACIHAKRTWANEPTSMVIAPPSLVDALFLRFHGSLAHSIFRQIAQLCSNDV